MLERQVVLGRLRLFTVGAILIFMILFFLPGCLKQSSGISKDKFAEVYVELSIAKETFFADSAKLEEEKGRIFKEANVTPQEMDDFANKLNQNPGEWAQVWKKIVERLEQKREELK